VAAAVVAIWSAWASIGICAILWVFWARNLFQGAPAKTAAPQ
jgi:hypothetical protein